MIGSGTSTLARFATKLLAAFGEPSPPPGACFTVTTRPESRRSDRIEKLLRQPCRVPLEAVYMLGDVDEHQ